MSDSVFIVAGDPRGYGEILLVTTDAAKARSMARGLIVANSPEFSDVFDQDAAMSDEEFIAKFGGSLWLCGTDVTEHEVIS